MPNENRILALMQTPLYYVAMRIGIDCRMYSSSFTGIGRYTHELVDHILSIDKENEIVLFFNNPEFKKFSHPRAKKVLVNAKHYSLSEQIIFCRKLYKEKCDIVHFPHFNVPILYRRPYTITIHDLTLSLYPGQKMTRWYHRLAYSFTIKNAVKKAKKIIAISHNTKADLIHYLHAEPKKIHVIYNGVSPDFTLIPEVHKFDSTLKKYGITKQFLFYAGVHRSHKNLPTLIKAFEMLSPDLNLQLVITGRPDPHYPEVQNAASQNPNIILTNLVSEQELVYLYNAAMIFVFPSLYEGFGLPPLESMSCGTPVVASNSSSIPEICGEDNALFFDPQDPQDIANKIDQLHRDSDLQAELIEKGARHAAKFTWDKMAKESYRLITGSK
ncbi:glycosyltransferase family 4 protein [Candidatus Gracilibacteria bacterium]|nr:glycosyltransferase family 4 protein [Candidatus Gracilibacteria bacterium]